jgi:uncharacterized phage protein (TIGR01671 family)
MIRKTREIKFRGWVIPNPLTPAGEMVNWNSLNDTVSIGWLLTSKPKDWVLMQYTGLKDKNGVEIYEGDILEWCYMEAGRGVVEYVDFYSSFAPFNRLRRELDLKFEVIGNIYENPEVLKELS